MLDASALPPPAIAAPAPYEASFGLVAGTAPPGTRRLIVRLGDRVLVDRPLRSRSYAVHVDLPQRELSLRVTAVAAGGRRSSATVGPVFGLPRGAARSARGTSQDPALAQTVRTLTRSFGGTSAVYVQDLATGRGAAWNARARFPAGSTLKLAIAVTVLRAQNGKPAPGTRLDSLLHEMVVHSDNRAANDLEVLLAGSTSAGSTRVNETMTALGLRDTLMYGGYLTRASQGAIPIGIDAQPALGLGKYTTAWDLARLARTVHLAALGQGPLLPLGVSGAEARYLLRLLAHVTDRGKLDRFLGGSAFVLHKAGWLERARHDNGLVYWPGGAYVAAVMTWSPSGVGSSSDVLAGRVAFAALKRFRSVG